MHPTCGTNTLQHYFLQTMIIVMSVVALLMATASTAAACGPNGQTRLGVVPQALLLPAAPRQSAARQSTPRQSAQDDSQQGIVGLWHVNYIDSTGAPYYESFDMWHADGTEWETAYSDPRQGNYCLGVWKKVGSRTVQLNHIAWIFNPDGTQAGYFTMTETNIVSRNGDSYTGTFDYKQYDVNGNFQLEITGTQGATRIKV